MGQDYHDLTTDGWYSPPLPPPYFPPLRDLRNFLIYVLIFFGKFVRISKQNVRKVQFLNYLKTRIEILFIVPKLLQKHYSDLSLVKCTLTTPKDERVSFKKSLLQNFSCHRYRKFGVFVFLETMFCSSVPLNWTLVPKINFWFLYSFQIAVYTIIIHNRFEIVRTGQFLLIVSINLEQIHWSWDSNVIFWMEHAVSWSRYSN